MTKPEATAGVKLYPEDLPPSKPHSLSFEPSWLDKLYDFWTLLTNTRLEVYIHHERLHIIIKY